MLPQGERPGRAPEASSDAHKEEKKTDSQESHSSSGAPQSITIRRLEHQNRKLRRKIHAQEKLKNHEAHDSEDSKKYSRYGQRIIQLLNNGYQGDGRKLGKSYRFGVIVRDQKTKKIRKLAEVQSKSMK